MSKKKNCPYKYDIIDKGINLLKNNQNEYKNYEEAYFCFKKAAQEGNINGYYNLGNLFFQSNPFIGKDYAKALYFYNIAAEKGHALAKLNLSIIYLKGGNGVKKDEVLGKNLLEKLVKEENPAAIHNLGVLNYLGISKCIPKDINKAKELLEISLNKGFKQSEGVLSSINKELIFNNQKQNLNLKDVIIIILILIIIIGLFIIKTFYSFYEEVSYKYMHIEERLIHLERSVSYQNLLIVKQAAEIEKLLNISLYK